ECDREKQGKSSLCAEVFPFVSEISVTTVNLSQYVSFSARDGISKAWVLPSSSNLTEKIDHVSDHLLPAQISPCARPGRQSCFLIVKVS
ncbi:hypothetical protein, partial [Pantoea agglomerans]|uniref:hypothetical protein n=1 Tax=Enterobacter agglomerans TaxID=549 RepID=UPI001D0C28AD